jgi:hypothetical protein
MLIVQHLARILLDMDALDADLLSRILVLLVEQHLDHALADNRMVELADLVALRQIGVEIILPVEAREGVDLRVQRHPGADSLTHALAVHDWKHARHGRIDEADLRVGLAPNSVEAPEKSFAFDVTCA